MIALCTGGGPARYSCMNLYAIQNRATANSWDHHHYTPAVLLYALDVYTSGHDSAIKLASL